MRIVKYEQENCPGCKKVSRYCNSKNFEFDEIVDAAKTLTQEQRDDLSIRSVPTVIAYDENGVEKARVVGPNLVEIEKIFGMRG